MNTKTVAKSTTGGVRWWMQPNPDHERTKPPAQPRQDLAGSSVAGVVFLSVLTALPVLALILWFVGSHFGVIVIQ